MIRKINILALLTACWTVAAYAAPVGSNDVAQAGLPSGQNFLGLLWDRDGCGQGAYARVLSQGQPGELYARLVRMGEHDFRRVGSQAA